MPHLDELPQQQDGHADHDVPPPPDQRDTQGNLGRHAEHRAQTGVARLLHARVDRHQEGDGGGGAQQRLDRQGVVEVDRDTQGVEGDPAGDSGADPADQVDEEPQRQAAGAAIDRAEFGLKRVHPFLRVLEAVAGDAGAQSGEQCAGAFLQPDEAEAGEHGEADPGLDRCGDVRSGHAQQQDREADAGEHDLGQELGGDIDDGGGGGGVPLDPMQRDRAGAEDEAAHLRERQTVGGGIAHHAAPDRHPHAAAVAGGHDDVPGEPEDEEQHDLPARDQGEFSPADAADRGGHVADAEIRQQEHAAQQAQKRQDIGEVFHRRWFCPHGPDGASGPCPGGRPGKMPPPQRPWRGFPDTALTPEPVSPTRVPLSPAMPDRLWSGA